VTNGRCCSAIGRFTVVDVQGADVRVDESGRGVAAIEWGLVDAAVRLAVAESLAAVVGHPVHVVRLRLVDECGRELDGRGTLIVGFLAREET
jgi:polysaccharide deacetylase 2 family uncharacterized protein YibQ